MSDQEIVRALRGAMVETGSLLCLGCGHEHHCSTHGCAVLRQAADRLEQLAAPASNPLTMEELRKMDGEPVWVEFPKCPEASGWMLVDVNRHCVYNGLLGDCDFENCGKTWLACRQPEEPQAQAAPSAAPAWAEHLQRRFERTQ